MQTYIYVYIYFNSANSEAQTSSSSWMLMFPVKPRLKPKPNPSRFKNSTWVKPRTENAHKHPAREEKPKFHCEWMVKAPELFSELETVSTPLNVKINITLSLDLVAPTTISRRRPIIPRHRPLLLVGQVLVDSRHPRVHVVSQQALATLIDMLGPVVHALLGGLEVRHIVVAHPADRVRHPVDGIFDASGDVAEHLREVLASFSYTEIE